VSTCDHSFRGVVQIVHVSSLPLFKNVHATQFQLDVHEESSATEGGIAGASAVPLAFDDDIALELFAAVLDLIFIPDSLGADDNDADLVEGASGTAPPLFGFFPPPAPTEVAAVSPLAAT
jgi:hypothetical protein